MNHEKRMTKQNCPRFAREQFWGNDLLLMRLWREYLKTDAQLRNEPEGEGGDEQLRRKLKASISLKIRNTMNTGNSLANGQCSRSERLGELRVRSTTLHPMYYAQRRSR